MFNKNHFSEILNNIVTQYDSISDFAKISKVGRSYISKYMNLKLDSPPSPKVLDKIAENSKGITTYEELMIICGHINNTSSINSLNLDILRILKKDKTDILKDSVPLNNNEQKILNKLIQNFNDSVINNSTFKYGSLLDNISEESKNRIIKSFKLYTNEYDNYAKFALSNACYIPMINTIQNPKNILSKENILDYIFLPEDFRPSNEFIAYLCTNDKMLPLLGIDDIAIIHLESKINYGKTYLVYVKNKKTCEIGKIIKDDKNNIEIIFMNPYFSSDKFDIDNVQIIGRVVRAENQSAFK